MTLKRRLQKLETQSDLTENGPSVIIVRSIRPAHGERPAECSGAFAWITGFPGSFKMLYGETEADFSTRLHAIQEQRSDEAAR